jgi:hypothetical protein
MHNHHHDDTDPSLGVEGDNQQGAGDAGDTREAWTRPRLSRLATHSTIANPIFGPDGGGGLDSAS